MAAKKKPAKSKKKPAKKPAKKAAKKPAKKAAKKAPAKKAAPKPAPSTRPLWQKLNMKAGTILIVNAPAGYDTHLSGGGASVATSASGEVEHAIVFINSEADLEGVVKPALGNVGAGTNLAVAYKKGDKQLHRDTLWAAMEPLGFEGVSLVAVDDTWSAMRFRRKESAAA
jgi:hypothetical protein